MNKQFITSIRDSFVTLLIVGGITACLIYKDSPELVSMAATIAFLGWIIEKSISKFNQAFLSKLHYAEAVDLSFLRQIRRTLKDGHIVSEEHISVSELASNDADSEYSRVFGFGRPLPAVASKKASNLQQN